MAGTKNDTLIGANADFSQAGGPNAASGLANGLATDGQLWIGRTAVNAGGTHIDVGTLTAGTGVAITNGAGTITIGVTGSGVGQTITGDTGGALSPTAGNWNILTANSTVKFVGSGNTLTQDFGLFNLILGSSASSITTGDGNVGLGFGNLAAVTTGVGNVAIGTGCLQLITTQSNNVSVGGNSLTTCIGSSNTSVGRQSCGSLTIGSSNCAFGSSALINLLTGVSNVAIGPGVGSNYTSAESSNILIQNVGTLGESNVIRIGTQGGGANQQNQCFIAGIAGVTNSNNTLVTQNSSTGQLGATTAQYPNSAGTSGNLLTSDGTNFVSSAPALVQTQTTWTPVLAFGGASVGITYTTQIGFYCKIGQMVIINALVTLSNKGSSTGNATITGLPFATKNTANSQQIIPVAIKGNITLANTGWAQLLMTANSTVGNFDVVSITGGQTQLADTAFTNTSSFIIQGSYISDA